jgi:hypothetical protein
MTTRREVITLSNGLPGLEQAMRRVVQRLEAGFGHPD